MFLVINNYRCGVWALRFLIEELAWATDKQFGLMITLLKTVIYQMSGSESRPRKVELTHIFNQKTQLP